MKNILVIVYKKDRSLNIKMQKTDLLVNIQITCQESKYYIFNENDMYLFYNKGEYLYNIP